MVTNESGDVNNTPKHGVLFPGRVKPYAFLDLAM